MKEEIEYQSPDDLNFFFMFDRVFGFNSELDKPTVFSFGYAFPRLCESDIPALHLLSSVKGGLATFVNETAVVDPDLIKAKIAELFGLNKSDIELKEIDRQQSHYFEFTQEVDTKQNVIPFEANNKMPVTHLESEALIQAFQDVEQQVQMISRNVFGVPCEIEVSLFLDTNTLKAAIKAGVDDEVNCLQFIKDSIEDGSLTLHLNTKNKPSPANLDKAKSNLFEIAALMILNKIKTVTNPDQLPDYEATPSWKETPFQTYLLEVTRDLGDQFVGIDLSKLVSKSDTPLPEPNRDKEDPIPPDPGINSCEVALDFDPTDLTIKNIEVRWGDQKASLKWPMFRPVVLNREAGNQAEMVQVVTEFSDFKENTAEFELKEKIKVPIEKVGFCYVTFDGSEVEDEFKSVTIKAEYKPTKAGLKGNTRNIEFPHEGWSFTWLLRTLAPDLGGEIKYSWEGHYNSIFKKDYKSGDLTTKETDILLKKK